MFPFTRIADKKEQAQLLSFNSSLQPTNDPIRPINSSAGAANKVAVS